MSTDSVQDPLVLIQLFNQAKPDLLAMDPANLVRPYIGRSDVVDLSRGLLSAIAPYRGQCSQVFSTAAAEAIETAISALEPMAFVYYQAELNAEAAWTNADAAEFDQLYPQVDADDSLLGTWAQAAFLTHPEALAEVKRIAPGYGRRDDAEDVLVFIQLFQKNNITVGPIQAEYLAAAEQRASRLIQLLSAHEETVTDSPAGLRKRAFTRWLNNYNEILATGRYLARNNSEDLQKFVGPRSKPTNKAKLPITPDATDQNA